METSLSFQAVREDILRCGLCEKRFGFEPHPVVFGNEKAPIVQISQAPSRHVHITRRPFDDASGRTLRGVWYRITDEFFYDPDRFFLTSMGHCYPGKAPGGGDRQPPRVCARTWMHRELATVQNEMYVIIGSLAAGFFFPGQPFPDLVFRDQRLDGKPAFVLPHPSPLNSRWFAQYPLFLERRIVAIRRAVHATLGMDTPFSSLS